MVQSRPLFSTIASLKILPATVLRNQLRRTRVSLITGKLPQPKTEELVKPSRSILTDSAQLS